MDEKNLLERIEQLEKDNLRLNEWKDSVNQIMSQLLDVLEQQKGGQEDLSHSVDSIKEYIMINRWRIDSLPYEMADHEKEDFLLKPHFLSLEETRRQLSEERKSIARYGDGEFSAIAGHKRWNFQGVSEWLGRRLKEVLQSDEEGFLVGLNPNFYGSLEHLSEQDADGVRAYMRPMVRRQHAELLSKEKVYANAVYHTISGEEDVRALKAIWDGRKVIIVEGVHTGMGVGNPLFDNCGEIIRVLGPAENAVDRYDDIMKEVCKYERDYLVLLALGPTATVMAYDLYKEGFQAIDAGHIDLVYEQYLRGANSLYSVKIPYKYCSADERGAGRKIEDITDEEYLRQVVARIY